MEQIPSNSPETSQEQANSVQIERFREPFRDIERELQPDGPPVVWAEVVTYVNGRLAEGERRGEVERNILTWRAWFDAFWEVIETRVESEGLDAKRIDDSLAGSGLRARAFKSLDNKMEGQ